MFIYLKDKKLFEYNDQLVYKKYENLGHSCIINIETGEENVIHSDLLKEVKGIITISQQ